MNDIVTAVVDENFDVRQRLARMHGWQNEYFSEDEQLQVRFRQLDANKPLDVQRGHQIGRLRNILILKQVREPLEVVIWSDQPGARHLSVRQNLVRQFASLSKMDRLRWLDNFLFIMTPDLLRLHQKILEHCALTNSAIFSSVLLQAWGRQLISTGWWHSIFPVSKNRGDLPQLW